MSTPSLVRPFLDAAAADVRPVLEKIPDLDRRLWTIVAEGRAEMLVLTPGPVSASTQREHRYGGYAAPIDDDAFASSGSVLLVR